LSGLRRESQAVGNVYPPEFKAQVVQIAREGEKSYVEIAKEFGLSPTSVANWVREAESVGGGRGGLSADERAELVALRKAVKKKDEELDILGKALAFFVRRADR
jgi:transposase